MREEIHWLQTETGKTLHACRITEEESKQHNIKRRSACGFFPPFWKNYENVVAIRQCSKCQQAIAASNKREAKNA